MNHYSPTAAYIHIPFCRRRCYYCDFAISVVGDSPLKKDSKTVIDYVDNLCKEIQLTANKKQPLNTVFFGGGTPSLLPTDKLARIIKTIENCLGIASDAEISIEIDPGTFDLHQLKEYHQIGINRISLGVQTFDSQLLKNCGRTHSTKDIFDAINIIKQANFKNFSIDLITGLPNQTIEHTQQSLEIAVDIAPPHISCYDLVIEPVTAFGKQYRPGKSPLPTDDTTAQMYKLTQEMLTKEGYKHYEISNYARSGYQCRHNKVYWKNQPYYGFGMSAASYFKNKRFSRPRTRKSYYDWVQKGAVIDALPLDKSDRLLETLMLGFRLTEGIDLSIIDRSFGEETTIKIINCLKPYIRNNFVILDSETKSRIKLNDPDGFLISNTILATLFEKLG